MANGIMQYSGMDGFGLDCALMEFLSGASKASIWLLYDLKELG